MGNLKKIQKEVSEIKTSVKSGVVNPAEQLTTTNKLLAYKKELQSKFVIISKSLKNDILKDIEECLAALNTTVTDGGNSELEVLLHKVKLDLDKILPGIREFQGTKHDPEYIHYTNKLIEMDRTLRELDKANNGKNDGVKEVLVMVRDCEKILENAIKKTRALHHTKSYDDLTNDASINDQIKGRSIPAKLNKIGLDINNTPAELDNVELAISKIKLMFSVTNSNDVKKLQELSKQILKTYDILENLQCLENKHHEARKQKLGRTLISLNKKISLDCKSAQDKLKVSLNAQLSDINDKILYIENSYDPKNNTETSKLIQEIFVEISQLPEDFSLVEDTKQELVERLENLSKKLQHNGATNIINGKTLLLHDAKNLLDTWLDFKSSMNNVDITENDDCQEIVDVLREMKNDMYDQLKRISASKRLSRNANFRYSNANQEEIDRAFAEGILQSPQKLKRQFSKEDQAIPKTSTPTTTINTATNNTTNTTSPNLNTNFTSKTEQTKSTDGRIEQLFNFARHGMLNEDIANVQIYEKSVSRTSANIQENDKITNEILVETNNSDNDIQIHTSAINTSVLFIETTKTNTDKLSNNNNVLLSENITVDGNVMTKENNANITNPFIANSNVEDNNETATKYTKTNEQYAKKIVILEDEKLVKNYTEIEEIVDKQQTKRTKQDKSGDIVFLKQLSRYVVDQEDTTLETKQENLSDTRITDSSISIEKFKDIDTKRNVGDKPQTSNIMSQIDVVNHAKHDVTDNQAENFNFTLKSNDCNTVNDTEQYDLPRNIDVIAVNIDPRTICRLKPYNSVVERIHDKKCNNESIEELRNIDNIKSSVATVEKPKRKVMSLPPPPSLPTVFLGESLIDINNQEQEETFLRSYKNNNDEILNKYGRHSEFFTNHIPFYNTSTSGNTFPYRTGSYCSPKNLKSNQKSFGSTPNINKRVSWSIDDHKNRSYMDLTSVKPLKVKIYDQPEKMSTNSLFYSFENLNALAKTEKDDEIVDVTTNKDNTITKFVFRTLPNDKIDDTDTDELENKEIAEVIKKQERKSFVDLKPTPVVQYNVADFLFPSRTVIKNDDNSNDKQEKRKSKINKSQYSPKYWEYYSDDDDGGTPV